MERQIGASAASRRHIYLLRLRRFVEARPPCKNAGRPSTTRIDKAESDMGKDLRAFNIFDLRELALKRVPKVLFEFVDRGMEDVVSLRNNRAVFENIRFKPRTMVDVS